MKRLFWPLLIITLFSRLFRLDQPSEYIFDEVYHVPSIRVISQNNPNAYDVYAHSPEPNTAYDWLHPPLAKLIQATSIKLLGDNSFAWRFPAAVFGTISVAALYFLSLTITKNPGLSLLAASFFAFDNLQLTMSRIAMNDIFVTTWILLALAFFYRKQLLLTGIFTGLALATKHSAILIYPIFTIFTLIRFFPAKHKLKFILTYFYSLILLPLGLYLLSYSQMFLQGSTFTDFFNLHKQIYWYQTTLEATHSYQSTAWQWPLLIRPVWFYVTSSKSLIANIYNLGNPVVFWAGLLALTVTRQPFLLISYFSLFFPFILSPRIMFIHHYLPALPILCLILASATWPYRRLKYFLLGLIILAFLFFYPLNTALLLPENWLKFWFWLPTWR